LSYTNAPTVIGAPVPVLVGIKPYERRYLQPRICRRYSDKGELAVKPDRAILRQFSGRLQLGLAWFWEVVSRSAISYGSSLSATLRSAATQLSDTVSAVPKAGTV